MATVVTFITHPRERQVLKILFESYGYNVLQLPPSPKSFLQVVQSKPKAIIFEIPDDYDEAIALIKQIKSNTQTSKIKILGYGDHSEDDRKISFEFRKAGVTHYTERSLTTEDIRQVIKPQGGDLVTLHAKQQKQYAGELETTAKIMDPSTSTIERINIMVKRIGDLLAFPFTIAKVLSVTQSDTTGAQDLARAVEIDPVVVSTVLKVASSAYYSAGNRTASSMTIKDAIVRIGFTETKNIAISMSVMKLFTDEEKSVGFSREDFWFHSLAAGVIAGKIAKQANYPLPEVAFLCGLLHDFGIILLDEFFPAYLQSSLQLTTQSGGCFLDVQKQRWGMTHNDVVIRLFDEWRLPENVISAIREFHTFSTFESSTDPQHQKLVQIVGLSNTLAKSLALGRECDEFVAATPNEILINLNFPKNLNDSFFKSIYDDLNMFNSFLNLTSNKIEFARVPLEKDQFHMINFIDRSKLHFNPFEFYMLSQKNYLEFHQTVEEIQESENNAHVIVIHADAEDTTEDLLEFAKIMTTDTENNTEDENQPAREEKNVPVLVLSDSLVDDTNELLILPIQIDLRVFCFAVESLNLGHKFELQTMEISSEPVQEQKKTVHTVKRDFSFTNRVVDSFLVIIELHGNITVETFKSLMNIMIALLKKNRYLGLDFSQIESVSNEFLQLLENFRKALRVKKAILCPFSHKVLKMNNSTEQIIFTFATDTEVIGYVKQVASQMSKS